MPNGFDWRHYIGHFLVAFVIACYGAIFLYIYLDGKYERDMQERGAAAEKKRHSKSHLKVTTRRKRKMDQKKGKRVIKKNT